MNPPASNLTSRLMISKMFLENFKSYAGVQEIGPFHKCFSSIVGPNGSGKSNVIDALLFVFGKRAKQLRLNKVSELIHKSSKFPSLEYARVSVHFQLIIDHDSPDSFEVIKGSEFVISRIAYMNNSSKYTVNDKPSTYTDVGILLRSHGIDLDNNRFLILQGEVEQIAMMKPKASTPHEEGLLEYLEDIIGSNRFVSQIEQASKDLETLNEERTEKVNRLKVAEKERDNLSGSKAEAESYIEIEKEIRRNKNLLYQILETNETTIVGEIKSKIETNNQKLASAKQKLKESETNFIAMERTYEATEHDYSAISQELQKSTADFAAFERRDVKLQEDMSHLRTQAKKLQVNIDKEQKKEEDSLREAENLQSDLETSRRNVEDIRMRKEQEEAALQAVIDGLREATQDLRNQLEDKQAELAEAERSVSGLSTEKETIEMSKTLLMNRVQTARERVSSLEQKLVMVSEEKTKAEEKIIERRNETKKLKKEETNLTSAVENTITQESQLEAGLKTAIVTAEEARAALTAQQSNGSRSEVVSAILKASRKGGPLATAGVIGRLGDLATISPEYDVAISTACGGLDYVVCENMEGCNKCVQFLRETKGGRGSFIALSDMEKLRERMNRSVQIPEQARRLFDLINPLEERILPAFYNALKDTLVANDFDTAVKIAYVGDKVAWRVVTKDGKLIDISGAMSGGGSEMKSGGMTLSGGKSKVSKSSQEDEISAGQVQRFDDEVTSVQNQLALTRTKRAETEINLKTIQQKMKDIELEIGKLERSLKHLDEQANDIKERLTESKAETSLTPTEQSEMKSLEARISKIDRDIESCSPQLGSLRLSVAALQRKILDVGGPKLSRAQAKVDILSKQFDTQSAALSTKEVEEANLRKCATKAAAAKAKCDEDYKKTQEKLNNLLKEQEEMENDAVKVNTVIQSAKERMTEQEVLLKRITQEFNDLKQTVEKVKASEVDLSEEIKTASRLLKESNQRLDQHRKHLEVLRKTHVDEQKEFNSAVRDILRTKRPVTGTTTEDVAFDEMIVDMPIEELSVMTPEELETALVDPSRKDDLSGRINLLEEERDKMKGNVNMNALMEYLRKDAGYRARLNELEKITEDRNNMRREYEKLRRQRLEEFMSGFGSITLKLKEMYQMITLGGDAELELVDSLDPFSEGIVFSVRPPKKSWKNISNLSGGEKTLSSLALVFALHHYKPTPLYVMDEIDAALDFKNVSIVANYIKERTKNAQFIIISLRNNMFELADRLVGIYKTYDVTKSVTINPKLFADLPVALSSVENPSSMTTSKNRDVETVSTASSEPPSKIVRRTVLADTTNLN